MFDRSQVLGLSMSLLLFRASLQLSAADQNNIYRDFSSDCQCRYVEVGSENVEIFVVVELVLSESSGRTETQQTWEKTKTDVD